MKYNTKLINYLQDKFQYEYITSDMANVRRSTINLGFCEPYAIDNYLYKSALYEHKHGQEMLYFWSIFGKPEEFDSRYDQQRQFIEIIMNTPEYNFSTDIIPISVGGHTSWQHGTSHRTDGIVYDFVIPKRTKYFV